MTRIHKFWQAPCSLGGLLVSLETNTLNHSASLAWVHLAESFKMLVCDSSDLFFFGAPVMMLFTLIVLNAPLIKMHSSKKEAALMCEENPSKCQNDEKGGKNMSVHGSG